MISISQRLMVFFSLFLCVYFAHYTNHIVLIFHFISHFFSSSASNVCAIAYFFCIFRRVFALFVHIYILLKLSVCVLYTEISFQLKYFEWIKPVKYVKCYWTAANWNTHIHENKHRESVKMVCVLSSMWYLQMISVFCFWKKRKKMAQ